MQCFAGKSVAPGVCVDYTLTYTTYLKIIADKGHSFMVMPVSKVEHPPTITKRGRIILVVFLIWQHEGEQ